MILLEMINSISKTDDFTKTHKFINKNYYFIIIYKLINKNILFYKNLEIY